MIRTVFFSPCDGDAVNVKCRQREAIPLNEAVHVDKSQNETFVAATGVLQDAVQVPVSPKCKRKAMKQKANRNTRKSILPFNSEEKEQPINLQQIDQPNPVNQVTNDANDQSINQSTSQPYSQPTNQPAPTNQSSQISNQ